MKTLLKGVYYHKLEESDQHSIWFLHIDKYNEITIYDKRTDPMQRFIAFQRKPSDKAEPVFIIKQTYKNTISYHDNFIDAIRKCRNTNLDTKTIYHIEIDWDEFHRKYYYKKWNDLREQRIKQAQINNKNKKITQGSKRKRGRPKGSKNKKKK